MSPRLFKSSQIWSLCLLHRIQSIKSRQFFIEHLFTLFHPDATCPTFVDFRFQDRRNIYQLLFQPSPLHRHLLCLKIYFFVLNCRRACNQIWRNLRISKFVNWNAKTCDAISLILVLFYILNQGSHGLFSSSNHFTEQTMHLNWLQRDSNLDCRSWKRSRWPLWLYFCFQTFLCKLEHYSRSYFY